MVIRLKNAIANSIIARRKIITDLKIFQISILRAGVQKHGLILPKTESLFTDFLAMMICRQSLFISRMASASGNFVSTSITRRIMLIWEHCRSLIHGLTLHPMWNGCSFKNDMTSIVSNIVM